MKTITFLDQGQSFSEWDIDHTGVVIASRPAPGKCWIGARVLTKRIRPGMLLKLRFRGGAKYSGEYRMKCQVLATSTERNTRKATEASHADRS